MTIPHSPTHNSTQLSPHNWLSPLKSLLNQNSLHETNVLSNKVYSHEAEVELFSENDSDWSVMTSYVNTNTAQTIE